MANRTNKLLLYAERDYAFDILRPLQNLAVAEGREARWFIVDSASRELLRDGEIALNSVSDVIAFAPDFVFAPGDRVPSFFPGLKVQLFHGLNEDKRGNVYPERGLFDLYCTEGPARTDMLQPLAHRRGYFRVRETGWVKLDSIFSFPAAGETFHRPQILYASTFTERLSSAVDLYAEIKRLSQSSVHQWLVTLHPKMAADIVERYRSLANENLQFFSTDKVIELLHRADIMVSDNSSILQEFLLLTKPVVTYRNRAPESHLIDIRRAEDLQHAITMALAPDSARDSAIRKYATNATPWLDGASAKRVLAAADEMIADGWVDRKPKNIWRNLKMRRQLRFFSQ
jgi:hypothetical protein